MLLLPREHGAYSQMALPLVTSFVVSGVTLAAALTALAVILGFLAHEPLMVLLGRRGARVRDHGARRARRTLTIIGAAMIAVGITAIALAPAPIRLWFALPLLPATVVAAGVMRKQEKSGPAEIAVALSFSLAAVPICLAAGASPATALSIGSAFAVNFVGGVLAVRVVILRVRAGGNPKAVRATRAALGALAAIAAAVFTLAAARGALSWMPLLAIAPGLAAALSLACQPKTPALKTVGWTLMSSSSAAALVLMAGL